MRSTRTGILALLFTLLISNIGFAQPVMHGPARTGDYISAEWRNPVFSTPTVFNSFSSAAFFTGRISARENLRIIADLPVAYGSVDGAFTPSGDDQSDVGLGNPYLGIEYATGKRFVLESGLRLPINSANAAPFASIIGRITVTDRFLAFAPDYLPIHAIGNYVRTLEDAPIEFRLRGGPVLALYTGDHNQDTETLAFIDLAGWYIEDSYEFGVSYSSRVILGEDAQSELSVSGFAHVNGVYPGLTLGVPVGDGIRSELSFVLGATLRVPLN